MPAEKVTFWSMRLGCGTERSRAGGEEDGRGLACRRRVERRVAGERARERRGLAAKVFRAVLHIHVNICSNKQSTSYSPLSLLLPQSNRNDFGGAKEAQLCPAQSVL